MIKINNLDFHYEQDKKRLNTLSGINLEIQKGEFVCVVGASGSGKSTLLRLIAGLIQPTHGEITGTEGIKPAMVFQHFALFPWLNVYENVAFGLRREGKSEEEVHKSVTNSIQRVKLAGNELKHPNELSGGMKQRVGVARALAMKPDLLLLDEPFSALDELTARDLRQDLLDIYTQERMTTVTVTHLISESVFLAHKVVVLSNHPGQVHQVININLPHPRDMRSKEAFEFMDKITEALRKATHER